MISLQQYQPLSLARIVKSFWCLRVTGSQIYSEDIIPDGHHEIIFHYNNHTANRSISNNKWIKEPSAFFAGQNSHSYSLELNQECMIYGIRFYPHTLNFLFPFPASETTDTLLKLEEIKEAHGLSDCLTQNADITFRNFEKRLIQLAGKFDFSSRQFAYIDYSVNEILSCKGDIKIDSLIRQSGVSAKHFDTQFTRYIGINPKSFCNIIKLNYFISYRNNFPNKNLTECAYEAAFFDQSHLIKLFRSVTGQTPRAWFNHANYINNHFTGL